MKFWRNVAKVFWVMALTSALMGNPWMTAESQAAFGLRQSGRSPQPSTQLTTKVAEVSPPTIFQELRQDLDNYQPQVSILSPRNNEVLTTDTVSMQFDVKDLPIYKDKKLGLGPHLHILLDQRPYQPVYDITKPLVFENLEPGTHTIRAIASRPWHETFKNDGAFAQLTFHVFTKTADNSPNPDLPLLTYSRPQGSYGAEPIMLDYYLTNAPLHLVAQSNPQDDIADWRIRVTVNGNSFVLDRWQPIYLKGFKLGKNWVQIEYLDESGNPVKNVFNNTVRLITYEPGGKDPLAQMVRGELTVADVKGIVDPNYTPPEPPKPTPTPTPSPTAIPTATPTPQTSPNLRTKPTPAISPTPPALPKNLETPKPSPNAAEQTPAASKNQPEPAAEPEKAPTQPEQTRLKPAPAPVSEKLTAPTKEPTNSSRSEPKNQPKQAASDVKERLQQESKSAPSEVQGRSPVAPPSPVTPPTPANAVKELERQAKDRAPQLSPPQLEKPGEKPGEPPATTAAPQTSAPLETPRSLTPQPDLPKSSPATQPLSAPGSDDAESDGITELRRLLRRIRQTVDQPINSTPND